MPGTVATRETRLPAVALGTRLLVVDPDAGAELTRDLEVTGLQVTVCTRGADALVSFGSLVPDVVLLAPRLPDLPAADVAGTFRRFGDQLILVGVGPQDTEAAGPILVAGATTAVRRPYDVHEVVHRIVGGLPHAPSRAPLTFGPLALDPLAHTVRLGDRELEGVPLKEFTLLRLLMTYADQVVSTEQIRAALWALSERSPSSNAVAVHVRRLRTRLREPIVVRTVRGLGYRLTLGSD